MQHRPFLLVVLVSTACTSSDPAPAASDPMAAAPVLPTPAMPPAPRAPAAVRLPDPGPQAISVLGLLTAETEIVLPARKAGSGDALPLPSWTTDPGTGTHTHPAPTRFDHAQYRESPPGTALLDEAGNAVAYAASLAEDHTCGDTTACWEVQKGVLYYRGPSPTGFTLRHTPTSVDEQRRTPALAGLPPVEFVSWEATIDSLTREVLLVPAGGRISQPMTIPPASTLRFGLGAPPPRLLQRSGSYQARIQVDGTEIWTGTTQTGTPWTEHAVDLSPWAGQTVSLTFETQPDAPRSLGSIVAFAEPELAPNAPDTSSPRRVVLVGIDTLRLDHLGLHGGPSELTPGLDAWGQSALLFDQARAPAPRTRPSFRSALTGRWPIEAIGAPPLSRVFADAGFSTAGIVANVHLQPHLGFADGAGWWDYHDSDDADPQVDRAIEWLDAHSQEDSFLFLHLMDPHIFYLAPEPFRDAFTGEQKRASLPDRYNRWTIAEAMQKNRLKDHHKAFIEARYRGEVRYLDHALSRLLAHIEQMPGDTVVVLFSDHGEELWDHGDFEHNHSLYDELMRTMLWIRPPGGWSGGPVRVSQPVSLVDLAPTLYDLLDLPPDARPPTDGISLAPFLQPEASEAQQTLAQQLEARPLPMGHMMFAPEQWGVVHQGWTYTLETATGTEEAFYLPDDPTQQRNRLSDAPLDALRSALSQATHAPVGSGWRIKVERMSTPFSMEFDQPVTAAGVVDPEAHRERRANIEWGEVPPVRPSDVATVTLEPDGRTVSVTPGPQGSGTLFVLGPTATSAARVHTEGLQPYSVSPGSRMLGRGTARIAAGTVIVPSGSEAGALAEQGDPRLYEALRAMGYIE